MPKVNKYSGTCLYCGKLVARHAGYTWLPPKSRRFVVAHLACYAAQESQVTTFVMSSGEVFMQNKRGRCEDAIDNVRAVVVEQNPTEKTGGE